MPIKQEISGSGCYKEIMANIVFNGKKKREN